jgi:hypothetical protein
MTELQKEMDLKERLFEAAAMGIHHTPSHNYADALQVQETIQSTPA